MRVVWIRIYVCEPQEDGNPAPNVRHHVVSAGELLDEFVDALYESVTGSVIALGHLIGIIISVIEVRIDVNLLAQ